MEEFKFQLQTNTYYGFGWSRNLGELLDSKGFHNVLLYADEGCVEKNKYFQEIATHLRKKVSSLHIEALRGTEEPDYDYLDTIVAKARSLKNIDVILGIGGGSCLDIVKAVAVLLTNPGKGINYRGFDKVTNPGIPTIAIPTTAGTGSEVTINAVFTDKNEMRKLGINGHYMNATYAVLDAEWTLSCPVSVAVSSGMDALTHTLESFTCKQHNTLTRLYSREAFRLLYNYLPSIIHDPENAPKRQLILLGSYLAATALFNSGSGIAGALSYPLGVHFKIPHGICGGIFLASVCGYNARHGYSDYSELLDIVDKNELSCEQKNFRFAEIIQNLLTDLGVPKHLDKWGVNKENVEEVAKLMYPMQMAFDQNPIPFSAEKDALAILLEHVD